MSPRPLKLRRVHCQPGVTYFKPRGIPMRQLEEVILTIDENEAIRLKNLEELDQNQCADKMKVSQSTFQRIITSANKKIADALYNGKAIKIEGGNVQFPKRYISRFK